MSLDTRSELIEQYFGAVDDADYELLRSVFTDDVTYKYHEGVTLEGIDDVIPFLRNEVLEPEGVDRTSVHEVTRRISDGSVEVCEGYVEGTVNGTEFETDFVDVFEFDEDDSQISLVATYTRR